MSRLKVFAAVDLETGDREHVNEKYGNNYKLNTARCLP